MTTTDQIRYLSVGKAFGGAEIRIDDPDSEGQGEVRIEHVHVHVHACSVHVRVTLATYMYLCMKCSSFGGIILFNSSRELLFSRTVIWQILCTIHASGKIFIVKVFFFPFSWDMGAIHGLMTEIPK